MNRMRNLQVVKNWAKNDPIPSSGVNHNGTLRTDGLKLWSYELQIGDTCLETGAKVVKTYTAPGKHEYHSQTTSCHVNLAARYATVID